MGDKDYSTPGEYATLDEMAGKRLLEQQTGALSVSHTLRALLLERTALVPEQPLIVGQQVTLAPGEALMTTVLDIDGVEYEIFVRQAR